ncbi:hypothetical protein MTR_3g021330 [Medicago truncatula]|uniref:R13L1/DRL21-like LRR repeat region domain-containing protein n=1 Tax=Medicago truncatula TaxID=3880 RepID=G7IZ36_MEDTR|nr:hypothetical protein MTR_3g021330 [Medicago truncatula]
MAEVVVGQAFLSPIIQLIYERLASTDFRDYLNDGLVKKLEITLKSINKQVLDVIATDAAQQKGKIQRYLSGSINRFESRIKVLLKRLEFLANQKDRLQLHSSYYYEDGASDFATSSFMAESIVYGREREKEEIVEFLLSDSYNFTDGQLNLFLKLLKYLRMLSISGSNLLELADDLIRNLKLLCYLDLSYTEITSLPNSICMLYNLHTLLPEECFKLTKLPSNFCKLINLRHLNLKGTHIKKMPKEIRELFNLEILTDFVVGEQHGYDIKVVNVADPADAMAANLKDKKHLEELSLSYDELREMDVTKARVSILEALRPNRNLMRLGINDYRGSSFPNWLGDHHLPNLVSLELLGCKYCSQLPPLGQFPSLKKLSISGCHGITFIGSEFCGYNSSNVPFRSLETLCFKNMSEWKVWLCRGGFPFLKELCIKHCPKLKSDLPQYLPCLQKLEIIDCQELEASIPKAGNISELELKRCDEEWGLFQLKSLKQLSVSDDFEILESFPEESMLPSTINSLELTNCSNLRKINYKGLLHLTSLESLYIEDCPCFESLPEEGLPISLSTLSIHDCPLIKQLYQKEQGERWHTISHIPYVTIS